MTGGRKVAVVLPAYYAAKTLRQTTAEVPHDIVDDVILTDDASRDATLAVALAAELGIHTVEHRRTRGYPGDQKSCYAVAPDRGADVLRHSAIVQDVAAARSQAGRRSDKDGQALRRWRPFYGNCPFMLR